MTAELHTLGAAEIGRRIRAGTLTASEITEACIARIEAVDEPINAFTILRFEQARAEATAADEARGRGEPTPPLHGVPITIKDQFMLAGTAATIGLRSRADHIDLRDGPLIARLRAAGAIVLGKTNVLQALLGWECDNALFGRTNNPWDPGRTPGGSSGGEAAAVAAGMSPLGIGGDFGGSVRLPACFCGVAGLKPTANRLSVLDTPPEPFSPQEAIIPQMGPLARNVEDIELAMGVLATPGQEAFDPTIPPVPWRGGENVSPDELRIGWWDDDGLLPTSPAIRRAIASAAEAFEAAGARVVRFEAPDGARTIEMFLRLLGGDKLRPTREAIGSEKPHPAIAGNVQMSAMPPMLRKIVGALMNATGRPRVGRIMRIEPPLDTDHYFQALAGRRRMLDDLMQRMNDASVDVLLSPLVSLPAFVHGSSGDLLDSASAMVLQNILGLPAGTVPVTTVAKGETDSRPTSKDPTQDAARRVDAGSVGLPVGVQLTARPWREDLVLAAMAILERESRKHDDYPHTPVDPAP